MTEEHLPHKLQLHDRRQLTMTGVTEVISFDDNTAVLQTAMGVLIVQGQQLQLKNLSLEAGQTDVEGNISGMIYEESRTKSSWRQRLFG